MSNARRGGLVLLAAFCLVGALRPARIELPVDLAGADPLTVDGHDPRRWNRPLSFGPWRTSQVREGLDFSWSTGVFGARAGTATRPFRLVLEGGAHGPWEAECRSRAIELARWGWSVDVTGAFRPHLACGFHRPRDGAAFRLAIGSRGRAFEGSWEPASRTDRPLRRVVRSIHRLEGSRISIPSPAGWVLEVDGTAVAAVETLNRGRVWISDDIDQDLREEAAAVALALLLFEPDPEIAMEP